MIIFKKIVDKFLKGRMQKNLPKAQYFLDNQIFADMQPYMPMVSGAFIQAVRLKSSALAGTGQVCVATGPQGRYLYEGKAMVDSQTLKGPRKILVDGEVILRFRKGATLIPTARPLNYSKSAHPMARDHWYEAARDAHIEEWKKSVRHVLIHGKAR